LSWFIAAQGHETDPDCNDYLTSKWLGLIRPLVAGFHSPLTLVALIVTPSIMFAEGTVVFGNRTGLVQ